MEPFKITQASPRGPQLPVTGRAGWPLCRVGAVSEGILQWVVIERRPENLQVVKGQYSLNVKQPVLWLQAFEAEQDRKQAS